ncbi:glycosyltransferase family 4 protein [Acidipila sp. EB88]|uniref:glycosyltransferase family 4 protein n=1 Tax=Acidipila sp. EB88 TaxID=2305226 RepID=UPI000F5FE7D5|nr:glycosyltransferase family 4 protein [Acidipila sp. EB88]RRA48927.1 glycosyltransferase [Acidipila sp. EB88]
MHVLLTTDSVGGVWTYTEELSAGLVRNGHRVTLVSFGRLLDDGQRAWLLSMDSPSFDWIETEYALEWMTDVGADLVSSVEMLRKVVHQVQPDVLHSNQFAYGELADTLPVLLTGHSDVLGWWEAVHGESAPDTGRLRAYTSLVRAGLQSATRLAAPTAWMARELRQQYGINRRIEVVANGRSPELFAPGVPAGQPQREGRVLQALTVGRTWDPGKHVTLLEQLDVPMPLIIAGEGISPASPVHVPVALPGIESEGVTYLGKQTAAELRELYSRTAIYIATSCYEPFGLAPLEAALSGCALVLSDLPTLREIWGDAALYYPVRDAEALSAILVRLAGSWDEIEELGARALARARTHYSAEQMVKHHEALYASLVQVATA